MDTQAQAIKKVRASCPKIIQPIHLRLLLQADEGLEEKINKQQTTDGILRVVSQAAKRYRLPVNTAAAECATSTPSTSKSAPPATSSTTAASTSASKDDDDDDDDAAGQHDKKGWIKVARQPQKSKALALVKDDWTVPRRHSLASTTRRNCPVRRPCTLQEGNAGSHYPQKKIKMATTPSTKVLRALVHKNFAEPSTWSQLENKADLIFFRKKIMETMAEDTPTSVILDTWGIRKQRDTITCSVRMQGDVAEEILMKSGVGEVFFTPGMEEKDNFTVIWQQFEIKHDIERARAKLQYLTHHGGLVANSTGLGFRVPLHHWPSASGTQAPHLRSSLTLGRM